MPIEANINILPSELGHIVQSVFETMLRLEVGECETPWFPEDNRLTSAVHLAGDWSGALLLECNHSQACYFAGRYLSIETPASVDDVVRDVLGELANMIGGNMKCAMIPGIHLSMPSVVDGSEYHLRVCGTEVRDRLSFHCSEGFFWVTVLATKPST
jgi:chemotaxis protein CheX